MQRLRYCNAAEQEYSTNRTHMKLGLYAIVDTKACEIVGGVIHQHRHVAPMIRMFATVMQQPNFAPHKADYQLHRLGYMSESDFENPTFIPTLEPNAEIIADGNSIESEATN